VKRLAAFLLVMTALTLAPFASVVADEYDAGYGRRHPARIAYAGTALAESACSVGWWQTLRYGHVRPAWGVRCTRYGYRRRVD
jgi:hypothetical protein